MNLEEKVRQSIKEVLQDVTKQNAPKVYNIIQTVEGYKKIEDRIIRMMISDNFEAGACIIPIERNL